MKFDFKPSENNISFREYLNYLAQTLEGIILYKKTVFPAGLIAIFCAMTFILSKHYIDFGLILIVLSSIIVLYSLIFLLINKLIKRKAKKPLKVNKVFCDIESRFYFTIEDGNLIRENEFSNINLQLSKIKEIKILKYGLILYVEIGKISIFIPKDVLPVTLEEFILLIKEENNDLIIKEELKREKDLLRKTNLSLGIILILACISGFFIGKYNYDRSFTRYNLIMGSNLVKQENNTSIYENEDLGISLTFPSKWEGKFGIEEMEDSINVYYLAKGKQSHNTTLLFVVSDLTSIFDGKDLSSIFNGSDFNFIKAEGEYIFKGPTEIQLIRNSKEHIEYLELYTDIRNIELGKNQYNNIDI